MASPSTAWGQAGTITIRQAALSIRAEGDRATSMISSASPGMTTNPFTSGNRISRLIPSGSTSAPHLLPPQPTRPIPLHSAPINPISSWAITWATYAHQVATSPLSPPPSTNGWTGSGRSLITPQPTSLIWTSHWPPAPSFLRASVIHPIWSCSIPRLRPTSPPAPSWPTIPTA